jgi:hypothetical protein
MDFPVGIPSRSHPHCSRHEMYVTEPWKKEYVYVLKRHMYVYKYIVHFLARIVMGSGFTFFPLVRVGTAAAMFPLYSPWCAVLWPGQGP